MFVPTSRNPGPEGANEDRIGKHVHMLQVNQNFHAVPRHREYTMNASQVAAEHRYELRFQSLFNEGRGYSFPCDAQGNVDMNTLSEKALNNYLYARAVIGLEVAMPRVQACSPL